MDESKTCHIDSPEARMQQGSKNRISHIRHLYYNSNLGLLSATQR